MLLIDDRERPRPGQSSNRDIIEQLRHYREVEFRVTRLESADCRFHGNGPVDDDHPDGECIVGIERKRLSDLINSMKDRRLSGRQLREMANDHEFSMLVVEGMWRPGKYGEIEEYRRRGKDTGWYPLYGRGEKYAVSYRQLAAYLTTLMLCGGVPVIRTSSAWETAAWYVAIYHWFNEKRWDQHKSHDQIYTNQVVTTGKRARVQGVSGVMPTELWMMAAQLNGVDEKAKKVEQHFGSIRAMGNSTVRDWLEIDGIGKKTAEYCVATMRKDVRV